MQIVTTHNLNLKVDESPVAPDRDTSSSQRQDIDLSVICLLVSQRGGHLQVTNSTASGTTLTIFLPPVDVSVRNSEPTEFQLPVTRDAPRILVVDDDEALRRFAATILDSAGFGVHEADSGEEAIRICEQGPTPMDLVLADVVMPKMSGRQLATHIASHYPQTKVLLMSGFPNVSGLLSGIASRSDKSSAECEFLTKPFTPSGLLQKVRNLLNLPASG